MSETKIGVVVETGPKPGGEYYRWPEILDAARTAEAVGFDNVWIFDRLLHRSEEFKPLYGSDAISPWESVSTLAGLAVGTTAVGLGTLVINTNYRNPAVLAKSFATIDEISGGRVILGLGAGGDRRELSSYSLPTDRLGRRFAEAIEIVHRLFHDGCVDFDGQIYRMHDAELRPRGPRPGGPPLLIAARGPRSMRLAAQYGDYWHALRPDLAEARAELDRTCREIGREPATLRGVMHEFVSPIVGREEHAYAPSLSGSADEITEGLRAKLIPGFDQLIVWPDPSTPASMEALAPVIDQLRQA